MWLKRQTHNLWYSIQSMVDSENVLMQSMLILGRVTLWK